jgi:hypothetical protein
MNLYDSLGAPTLGITEPNGVSAVRRVYRPRGVAWRGVDLPAVGRPEARFFSQLLSYPIGIATAGTLRFVQQGTSK